MSYHHKMLRKWAGKPDPMTDQQKIDNIKEDARQEKALAKRGWKIPIFYPCPPHLWIRDGAGAVCTHCGVEITEVEKYAPFERHER